jgi:hypothetical protein
VANQIEVRLASSSERTDLDIAAAAVQALEEEAFGPVEKLDVTVLQGLVRAPDRLRAKDGSCAMTRWATSTDGTYLT